MTRFALVVLFFVLCCSLAAATVPTVIVNGAEYYQIPASQNVYHPQALGNSLRAAGFDYHLAVVLRDQHGRVVANPNTYNGKFLLLAVTDSTLPHAALLESYAGLAAAPVQTATVITPVRLVTKVQPQPVTTAYWVTQLTEDQLMQLFDCSALKSLQLTIWGCFPRQEFVTFTLKEDSLLSGLAVTLLVQGLNHSTLVLMCAFVAAPLVYRKRLIAVVCLVRRPFKRRPIAPDPIPEVSIAKQLMLLETRIRGKSIQDNRRTPRIDPALVDAVVAQYFPPVPKESPEPVPIVHAFKTASP